MPIRGCRWEGNRRDGITKERVVYNGIKKKFNISLLIFFLFFAVMSGTGQAKAEKWKEYWIIVDEHDKPLSGPDGWYYNPTGGDRGMLNMDDINYIWDGDNYTAEVVKSSGLWTWGGMWYSLGRINRDNIPLNFSAIFGPYIKSEYQGEIVEAEIVVSNFISSSNNEDIELRLELKDENERTVYSKSWTNLIHGSYPKTYNVSLNASEIGKVKLILWIIDKAKVGDSISIDRIRLKARVPDLPSEEQAFYWTYSWLMANYDPNTGIVQDRSNFKSGDFENIPATAKAAKITYYAYKKGYVTYNDAEEIITKIADTLINVVPRGPHGVNTLWPHFTKKGGTEIVENTEWSSGDTAYAALDIITALQMLGDPEDQMKDIEDSLKEIDWEALLSEDGGISHGYSYEGDLLPYSWKGFGMETIGVNWAYASATGKVAIMESPPSDNGAGFIDNANYPIVLSGKDCWGNNWDEYRNVMADKQIGWYCQEHYNEYLCDAGLFGLSAAENPEGDSYVAYGVGGKIVEAEDGNGEVIVLHYAGMIADIRPREAKHVWETLRDRNAAFLKDKIVISPLNNMESMRVNKSTGECTINYLKGSWNLALQAEGWAQIDPDIRNDLTLAIQDDIFLKRGYDLLKGIFDTGKGKYPSIFGTHNGTIKPLQTITVSRLYTYPCEGTGGHSKYAKIYNNSWSIETLPWKGYQGDWHFLYFPEAFKLYANVEYNYTIITGSYPQIHHTNALLTANGWINCTSFVDVNGKIYDCWIPAIKLE